MNMGERKRMMWTKNSFKGVIMTCTKQDLFKLKKKEKMGKRKVDNVKKSTLIARAVK
jgi:hypothetical protein